MESDPTSDDVTGVLTRYAAGDGAVSWVKRFPTTRLSDVATHLTNGVTAAGGTLEGAVDLGDGTVRGSFYGHGFVAMFATDGQLVWARDLGQRTHTHSVAIDAAGNITASGWYSGSIDFGGQVDQSPPGLRPWIASWDAGGRLRWANTYPEAGRVIVGSIIGLADGDAIVAGHYETGVFTFGGTAQPTIQGEGFVARLSAGEGAVKWARWFGGGDSGGITTQTASTDDPTGRGTITILAAGFRAADFGGGPIPYSGCSSFTRSFLAGFSAETGSYLWSEGTCPSGSDDLLRGATSLLDDTVVVGAVSTGSIEVVTASGLRYTTGSGDDNVLVARVARSDGRVSVFADTGGMQAQYQRPRIDAVAVDAFGRTFIAGRTGQFSPIFGHNLSNYSNFVAG